jgi:hypothetical protein
MNDIAEIYPDAGLLTPNPSSKGSVWSGVFVGQSGNILMTKKGQLLCTIALPSVNYHVAELYAIIQCLEVVPDDWFGYVLTDNEVAKGWFFEDYKVNAIPTPVLNEMLKVRSRLTNFARIDSLLLKSNPTQKELMYKHSLDGRDLPVSMFNKIASRICENHKEYVILFET